jgi:hypothetical protein
LKRYILLLGLVFTFFAGKAQQNLSLFALNNLTDYSKVNPAYLGNHPIEISLFPLSYHLYSNKVTYRDFVNTSEARNASNILSFPEGKLMEGQGNILRASSEVATFRFVFNKNNWSFNVHHAARSNGVVNYSGNLAEMAIKGNAAFIGQKIPINTDFEILSFEELGIGAAYQFGKLKIGARFKYLLGHSLVQTTRSNASLLTDEEIYELTLSTDVAVEVAGSDEGDLSAFNFGPLGLDFTNKENVLIQSPLFLFDMGNDYFQFTKNRGVGFDFGLDWQINEQFSIAFSVLDIGKINWKESPRTFTANQDFNFDGLSLGQLSFDGSETISFDNLQDSFDIIEFAEKLSPFSTNLPSQFYLAGQYQLNATWRFYTTLYRRNFANEAFNALSLGANYQITKQLNIGASYSIMNESMALLGLNATFEAGPFQFYALTDNIFGVLQPKESTTLNARVGIAFRFGNKKREQNSLLMP